MLGSEWPNGLSDDPLIQASWATYIAKFITAYNYKGVPIWAVTPQNEPEFPAPWEACAYNAVGEGNFINDHLGPILRAAHPDVLILAFDHNKDHIREWAETIMGGDTGDYVDGMAFHWYGGMDRLTDGTFGYNELNATHHYAPDKILLGTEGCSCPGVELDDWFRAERIGHDVMFDLKNYAQGWIDWNLLVDSKGGPNHLGNICDASLVCKSDFSDFHIQPKFYYLGHVAKFVPPGSVRVQSTIVGNFQFNPDVDPHVQGNLEVGMFSCERSTRQMWKLNINHTIELMIPVVYDLDLTKGPHPVRFCVTQGDENRKHYLRLTDCTYHSEYIEEIRLHSTKDDQLIDEKSGMCLTIADNVREPGALLNLQTCVEHNAKAVEHSLLDHQVFHVAESGEITTPRVGGLCLTAGWPFLNAVAFQTKVDKYSLVSETVIVMMNEASVATSVLVFDKAKDGKPMGLSIDARAMSTILY
jgi:glucosylceramidase